MCHKKGRNSAKSRDNIEIETETEFQYKFEFSVYDLEVGQGMCESDMYIFIYDFLLKSENVLGSERAPIKCHLSAEEEIKKTESKV